MRTLRLILYGILLFYFLTFLIGRPQVQVTRTPVALEIPVDDSKTPPDFDGPSSHKVETVLAPGLFSRLALEQKALADFDDPLLESEARPQQLLKSLERMLALDWFLVILTVLFCILLILCGAALLRRHWFAERMETMLAISGLGFFGLYLLFFRRSDLIQTDNHPLLLSLTGVDLLFFFLLAAVLLEKWVGRRGEQAPDPFMAHAEKSNAGERKARILPVVYQLLLIALAGLLAANFLLFPLYSAQIYFPRLFSALLLLLALGLILFYIISYIRVSESESYHPSVLSALSFLGFRILVNSGFFLSLIVLTFLAISFILFLAIFNVNFLESMRLLWE